jgi:hypothetical protein
MARALAALEAILARRSAALMHEVAHYPTPIARCDEQLTGLIEQRTAALARLRSVSDLAAAAAQTPGRDWLAHVARWLEAYPAAEDADEAACVAHARAAANDVTEARP